MEARTPDVITVAVTRVDGGLTVLRVVTTNYVPDGKGGRIVHQTFDPTPEYIDSLIAKHNWQGPLSPVSWRIVPNDIVDEVTNRYFRNAWKDDGGTKPGVDMPKAQAIHMAHIRAARDKALEALDTNYMIALEKNEKIEQTEIANEKQVLRDIPATFDLTVAKTPEELYALWPAQLQRRV
jgi:hypothetical protein